MEEVEKAYLAGIIDGEGTVTLAKNHKGETPSPKVAVSNNKLELLEWIKKRAGGVIVSKRKNKPYHGNSYVWYLRQNKALSLLNDLKNFLIIKRLHAELILNNYKLVTFRNGKYKPEVLEKKMQLVSKIRKLNQRNSMPPIIRRAPEIKTG